MNIIKEITNPEVFKPHPNCTNKEIFVQFIPEARCFIIPNHDFSEIEVDNFIVNSKFNRGKGIGTKMIAAIKAYFPNAHIWVDTWNHSRPFWTKMMERGYIDSIGNDYSWPCFDTNCRICHPKRANGRRRIR